jgi:hypothetical protein
MASPFVILDSPRGAQFGRQSSTNLDNKRKLQSKKKKK